MESYCLTCDVELMQHESGDCLNLWVAQEIGLISCDEWEETNFGSAGGPALIKHCEHNNCYSTKKIGSVFGTVGGCPPYSTDRLWAFDLMGEVWKMDKSAVIFVDTIGLRFFWTAGYEKMIEGPTFPLRACRAAIWLVARQEK